MLEMNSSSTKQTDSSVGQMDYIMEPLGLRIFRLTLYGFIFLLATFGNGLVVFVVYKTRRLHTGKLLFSIFGKKRLSTELQDVALQRNLISSHYCYLKFN